MNSRRTNSVRSKELAKAKGKLREMLRHDDRLNPTARVVGQEILDNYVNSKSLEIYVGQSRLAMSLDRSERTISRAYSALKATGYIREISSKWRTKTVMFPMLSEMLEVAMATQNDGQICQAQRAGKSGQTRQNCPPIPMSETKEDSRNHATKNCSKDVTLLPCRGRAPSQFITQQILERWRQRILASEHHAATNLIHVREDELLEFCLDLEKGSIGIDEAVIRIGLIAASRKS